MSNPLGLKPAQARPLVNGACIRTDLKLLEVEQDLLEEIMSTGVVIKGPQADNEAVMCTGNKTYALKYVETTNSQLLVQPLEDLPENDQSSQCSPGGPSSVSTPPGLQTQLNRLHQSSAAPVVVTATTSGHIEVLECGPRLELLHQLLSQRPYGLEDEDEDEEAGAKDEEGSSRKRQAIEDSGGSVQGDPVAHNVSDNGRRGLYTFQDLVQLVQASPQEIRAGLKAMGAVEVQGFWRRVDAEYLGDLLERIIYSARHQGYPLTAIPCLPVANDLSRGDQPTIVRHCLSVYGHPVAPAADVQASEAMGTWSLDATKVCIYFMDKVLAQQDGSGARDNRRKRPLTVAPAGSTARPLSEFMEQWRKAVREAAYDSIEPDLGMLRGEVLVEGKGSAAVVRPLSIRQLPINAKQRFERLFAFKPQWEATELEPYLHGLQAPGQTPATLLLKFTRASQAKADAPTFYTAR